jgi:Family of unknown function (DUF5678)
MVTTSKAAEGWHRADEERAFWQAHQRDFLEKYPNQFVVLKDGQVIAHDASLDDLVTELEKQGLESTDVRLRYINACPGSSFI